jgi:hypothetical protein
MMIGNTDDREYGCTRKRTQSHRKSDRHSDYGGEYERGDDLIHGSRDSGEDARLDREFGKRHHRQRRWSDEQRITEQPRRQFPKQQKY